MKQTSATILCDACGYEAVHVFVPASYPRLYSEVRRHFDDWLYDSRSRLDYCPSCAPEKEEENK